MTTLISTLPPITSTVTLTNLPTTSYSTTTSTPGGSTSYIESAAGLYEFLTTNYNTCHTSIGATSFTFKIFENDSINSPYDYWIQAEYDLSFFNDLIYSNQISTETNHIVCNELKIFQQNLAMAVIEKIPNKKLYGQYFYSGYEYPSIKVGYWHHQYYTWVNYTPASIISSYNDTSITGFAWYDISDDTLWRQ
jgi:hypothetical protein